jgi:molybdopterin converting factor small subunit
MSPSDARKFTVRLFGPAQDRAGADRATVLAAEGCTCGERLRALGEQHPALVFALSAARLAVNHALAAPDHRPRPHDEIALIALVDGG